MHRIYEELLCGLVLIITLPPPIQLFKRLSSKRGSQPLPLKRAVRAPQLESRQNKDRKAILKFSAFAAYKNGFKAQLIYGNK